MYNSFLKLKIHFLHYLKLLSPCPSAIKMKLAQFLKFNLHFSPGNEEVDSISLD